MPEPLNVKQLLLKHGPSLTSDLAAKLRAAGLSADAARQRLSRLPDGVRVLWGLPFPKRARFIYLEKQFGTPPYWNALIGAIQEANPAYAAALGGVKARGGIVPRAHFDVASGSPVRQKKQLSVETVLERLVSVDLLKEIKVEGLGDCVILAGTLADDVPQRAAVRARLMTEDIVIGAIQQWLGRMNFASPGVTKIRGAEMPRFSTFSFDICGPSYLRPLRRFGKHKIDPGFFVGDIILGEMLDEFEVAPFIRKCQMLSHLRGVRPFVPMLIADGFTQEALRLCRSEGVVATRPDSLFGRDVAVAIRDLLDTLTRAGAVAATDPDKIEKIFTQLGSIEGAAANLRGALFELIVGHMVRNIEGGSIDIGDVVSDANGERREIDVRLVKELRVTIYECKSYQPETVVHEDEIETWLTDKVPVINRAHHQQVRFDGTPLRFEFWTCGTFSPGAIKALKDASSKIRKYEIGWRDGKAVREYAKGIKAAGIRKVLDEHYFKHPIAALAKNPKGKTPAKANGRSRSDKQPRTETAGGFFSKLADQKADNSHKDA